MNFIAIEGLDGSGKSMQINMLQEYLKAHGQPVCSMHFPNYDDGCCGMLIARYLRGEFGTKDNVNPYFIALMYAQNRRSAATTIENCLANNIFVIADRFVYSNIAYQCAKINDSHQQHELREWILRLEYEDLHIPKPQMTIFLDVPWDFTASILMQQRQSAERHYLMGKEDIHEQDIELQMLARRQYLMQAAWDKDFHIISCINENTGTMLAPNVIMQKILSIINL
jgi:dTMP kinase